MINTLQNKADELTLQNSVLMSKKMELETMNKDYFNRLTSLQQEVARNSDELTTLRNDNKRLDTLKFEHEKMLERLNVCRDIFDHCFPFLNVLCRQKFPCWSKLKKTKNRYIQIKIFY